MNFKEYLQTKRLKPSTIKSNEQIIINFTKWLKTEKIEETEVSYNDIIIYVNHLRERNLSPTTINIHLGIIGKYYNYLQTLPFVEIMRGCNPVKKQRIKGTIKKVLPEILTPEQLESIYHAYINKQYKKQSGKRCKITHNRNIVVLSLMIYQGLHSGELGRLETTHINLQKGNIYIPSGSRGNSRTLKLQAMQQIIIQNYLQNTKTQLHTETNTKLFTPENTRSIVDWLIKDLKNLHTGVQSAKQIRISVIMNWLKNYNIRQVQYMIGHRNISSTQSYKTQDIENLTELLNKYHPLK